MRSSLSSSQSTSSQQQQQAQHDPSSPPLSQSSVDWKSAPSSTSTVSTSEPPPTEQSQIKIDAMVPSQPQTNMYQTSFYPQEYSKPTHHYMAQGYSNHGASPYPRPTIHDRRQSLAASRSINTPPNSDPRSRSDYPVQGMNTALTDDLATAVSSIEISQPLAWDQAPPPPSMNSHLRGSMDATPHLPPLSEALHRIFPNPSEGSPSLQSQPQPQPTMTMVDNVTVLATTAPPSFYPVSFGEVPPLVSYPQEMPNIIRHPSPSHPMMAPSPNMNGVHAGYGRRVTHPFVPSIDTSSGLMMTSLTSPENSGSSPLIGSPFPHGGLVGVNSAPVSMTRSSPLVGYGMDTMTMPHPTHSPLQGHTAYPHAIQTHPMSQPHPEPAAGQPVAWMSEGGDMDAQNSNKMYSFIPLSGVNTKKRPRRRFDEIERLYVCNWGECEKSYGTLNHLNAHVNMQKHGPKRDPAEFKELRKAWRRHKRAEEEAAKQAAAFHQQQNQNPLICEPVLTNMHQMTMHGMTHHQPHQLPHPHAHPNQHHPHPHTQAMHHPMGF
ncbi:hypothetical protein MVEG_03838 [Podila verticillata NRRL 6337]|nr:hypothetical protein MVEG_03838 [Podila verticillata NRRL 6337]